MKKDVRTRIELRLKRLEEAVFGSESEKKVGGNVKSGGRKQTGFSGAKGGVRLLASRGFFRGKQGLSEVKARLSGNGYHYSRQAVHGALVSLARKGGPLVSLEVKGAKVYVDRK